MTTTMSTETVTWTEDLEVGIREIDEQHKTLFDLLNRLQTAASEGSDAEVIGPLLVDMAGYAERHFKTEQFYLEKHPDFRDHLIEHWEFSKKCIKLVMSYRKDDSVTNEAVDFLLKWLKNHILIKDIGFFRDLKESGGLDI